MLPWVFYARDGRLQVKQGMTDRHFKWLGLWLHMDIIAGVRGRVGGCRGTIQHLSVKTRQPARLPRTTITGGPMHYLCDKNNTMLCILQTIRDDINSYQKASSLVGWLRSNVQHLWFRSHCSFLWVDVRVLWPSSWVRILGVDIFSRHKITCKHVRYYK